MAEIEITLPTVQYGNVKVRATPEELGVDIASPAAVGTATAIYLNLFTQGFKVGASMDVTASPTEGLKAPQGAEQSESEEVFAGAVATAQEEAQRLLSEGLGGATEVDDDAAPWDKPAVDAPAKPWETEVATW
ncbi:MAG TPA: hypothetical protein VLA89_13390 [Gemmatimonadales bacterium]|nr:hypothetical protein [Gemmatimonadales bacterium]